MIYIDPSGESFSVVTILFGAAIGAVIGAITAKLNGEDVSAGFFSGFASGAILTVGVALAVIPGGILGLGISGFFGFAGGTLGDVINQGISKGWNSVDKDHAYMIGGVTALFSMLTFGLVNIAMRGSAELFGDIFSKSLNISARIGQSLNLSIESIIITSTIAAPLVLANAYGNIFASYLYNDHGGFKYDLVAGCSSR